ncbi:hypothetical protein AMS69_05645 [Haloarcula rubripromontorii]|uniref:N-acetyltransferase domain-containing protein n=2 Tax=Haloarcula rubripromontorii TaxID=1705562 RepID=A0A0M9AKN6_9EURY|nr:hypothetical protein AMS69_05645 [Haloarcula rubripromontorii]
MSMENEGGEDVILIKCSDCGVPYYIGHPGNEISIDTALTEDWIFDRYSPEIDGTVNGLVCYYIDPPASSRINSAITAMVDEVNIETGLATDYNPDMDEFVLLSNGENIIGFISWSIRWGHKTLQQVYVRENSRNKGYGRDAIQWWFEKYGEDTVYSDQMNEISRKVFTDMGLFRDGDHETTVVEFSDFYPQGIEIDKKVYDVYPNQAFSI